MQINSISQNKFSTYALLAHFFGRVRTCTQDISLAFIFLDRNISILHFLP